MGVTGLNIANGAPYETTLPEGEYNVVVSTDGRETIQEDITISDTTSPVTLDINFPAP